MVSGLTKLAYTSPTNVFARWNWQSGSEEEVAEKYDNDGDNKQYPNLMKWNSLKLLAQVAKNNIIYWIKDKQCSNVIIVPTFVWGFSPCGLLWQATSLQCHATKHKKT